MGSTVGRERQLSHSKMPQGGFVLLATPNDSLALLRRSVALRTRITALLEVAAGGKQDRSLRCEALNLTTQGGGGLGT